MTDTVTTEAVASGGGESVSSAPVVETNTTPAVETTTTTPADAPKPSMDDTMRAAWRKHNPTRGDGGRFASPNPQPAPEASQTGTTEGAIPAEPTTAPEPAIEQLPEPHARWDEAKKAKFAALTSKEARELALEIQAEHEATFTRTSQEHANFRKQAEPFVQAIQPFQQYLTQLSQQTGLHPAQLVNTVMRAEYALRTGTPEQKAQALRQIVADYGIDAQSLATGQPAEAQQVDPTIAALRNEVNQLKGYLTQQQREQHAAREQATAKQQGEMQRVIDDFAKGKSDFSSLESDILALVPLIRQSEPALSPSQILEKAYERAAWANPTTRASRLAEQQKAAEKKRQEEAAKHALEAKKAAAPNVQSSVGKPKPKSMDDTLREAYRRASAA
jgi:hypothetical protein